MGQSRPYGIEAKKNETMLNLSVDASHGGGAGFQPGSTFKPIVAAAALEGGMPATKVYASPYEMEYPSPVQACDGKIWNEKGVTLTNENETEVGPYDMKEATAKSVNTYFIEMISEIGICPVTTMAEKMGVERADGGDLAQAPSIALGTMEMSPLTMAAGYATFASRGMYCTPVAIESVTQKVDGKTESLEVPKSTCRRAMSETTADTINTLLRGVVEDGTGTQAGLGSSRPSAGKTGTTDERYAAWFVGYTPNMAGSVWVGDPAHKRKMQNITIGGVPHDKVFGGAVPGPIWRDMMTGALEGKEALDFNLVKIPEAKKKDEDKDRDKDRDRRRRGSDRAGNNGGNGTGRPGDNPADPGFELPEGFIQGAGNGPGGRR